MSVNIKKNMDNSNGQAVVNDITPNEIVGEINKKTKQSKSEPKDETVSKEKLNFPVSSFPKVLQDVIIDFYESYDLPSDYYGLGILTVCAAIIGNSFKLRYKSGYNVPAILYSAIVGPSAIGKTPALMQCIKPLFDIEKAERIKYNTAKENYEQEVKAAKAEKRDIDEKEPIRSEIYISDATLEAVHKVHSNNPNGLLLFQDEIAAWINGFNQYRSGTDEQFYLSTHSNTFAKINRATKDTLDIDKPSISVLGGIQPSLLDCFATDGRKESGFLYRILFAYPINVKAPYDTGKEPHEETFINYKSIIQKLYKLTIGNRTINGEIKQELKETHLYLSDKARVKYVKFKNKNVDKIRLLNDDSVQSLYGKLSDYCLRFALNLEVLECVCNDIEIDPLTITIQETTIDKAIELTEYFRKTGHMVLDRINRTDPFVDLPFNYQDIYGDLPETFKTSDGLGVAQLKKMSESTFKRFIRNKDLFEKVSHGVYSKII